MSIRAKLVRSAALAAVALAAWRFLSPPAEAPLGNTPQPASEKAVANLPPVQTPTTAAGPDRVAPDWQSVQSRPGASQRAAPGADPEGLNERTLVGTKWEREGFGIEFGADGKLLIGGRERAKWRVEGPRIRLYHDTTGEEHWLDIVGNKLNVAGSGPRSCPVTH